MMSREGLWVYDLCGYIGFRVWFKVLLRGFMFYFVFSFVNYVFSFDYENFF